MRRRNASLLIMSASHLNNNTEELKEHHFLISVSPSLPSFWRFWRKLHILHSRAVMRCISVRACATPLLLETCSQRHLKGKILSDGGVAARRRRTVAALWHYSAEGISMWCQTKKRKKENGKWSHVMGFRACHAVLILKPFVACLHLR